jgi:hypothetical protein
LKSGEFAWTAVKLEQRGITRERVAEDWREMDEAVREEKMVDL